MILSVELFNPDYFIKFADNKAIVHFQKEMQLQGKVSEVFGITGISPLISNKLTIIDRNQPNLINNTLRV